MNEKARKFLEEVSQNPELKAELTKSLSGDGVVFVLKNEAQAKIAAEALAKVAQSQGYELTIDDFAITKLSSLSEDELKSVAGGIALDGAKNGCSCPQMGFGSNFNDVSKSCGCPSLGFGYDDGKQSANIL
ncbi:MAG: hypothetical protein IJS99_01360 [Synergistaceae bacterium]|nr:hypothetical protein [Synergistaceae bacterium]